MAATDLGTLTIVKANPETARFQQLSPVNISLLYGASMLSGGVGALSQNSVTNQNVVQVVITNPVQYWG